jgi:hypothetical protein
MLQICAVQSVCPHSKKQRIAGPVFMKLDICEFN